MKLLKYQYIFILFSLTLFSACGEGVEKKIELTNLNPKYYDFHFPIDTMKKVVIYSLENYKFKNAAKYENKTKNSDDATYYDNLSVETHEGQTFSTDFYKNIDNKNDLYVYSMMLPGPSSVYYSDDCKTPLDFNAKYQIKLERINDTTTRVKIITLDYEIITGYQRIPEIGICGFWRPPLISKLPVTTVEEYELLQRIGYYLKVKDMPELKIPDKVCLTRKGKVK